MSEKTNSGRGNSEQTLKRRRFLRYGGTVGVGGIGLGSTPALAGDDGGDGEAEEEKDAEGKIEISADGEWSTEDVPEVDPDEEIVQTWYFTIFCEGIFCPPGPFYVEGRTDVEHVETGQVIEFETRSWIQGYGTVVRSWELGTPAEWAAEIGLDSPAGEWNIVGKMWRDGVLEDEASIPIEVTDDECPLQPEIQAKRATIANIRDTAAGFGLPYGEVDQHAEVLLDEIADEDDCADTDDEEELEQFEEAVERMLAAEDITERATDAATEADGPLERIVDLLYEIAKGKVEQYIRRVAGGWVGKILDDITSQTFRALEDMLDSYANRGVIGHETFNAIKDHLNQVTIAAYYAIEAINDGTHPGFDEDDEPWEEIVDHLHSEGASGARAIADELGVTDAVEDGIGDDIPTPRDALAELLFRGYYDSPWLPELHVPAPEEIETPNVDVSLNLPNDYLPWGLGDLLPDVIEFDIDTPDIPLPEVPVFTDVHRVRDGLGVDPGLPAGVNNSIDNRMRNLELALGNLDAQSADAREHVRDVMTGGIDAVNDVATAVFDGMDWLSERIGWLADKAGSLATLTLALAGVALVTVTGLGVAIALAGAALKIIAFTAKLTAAQLFLSKLQAAVGAASALYYANLHHVGVIGIVEDDLGGVVHG